MPGDTQRQRQGAEQVPDDQTGDDGGGDDQVRGDDAARPAGQVDDLRDGGQLVADDDRVGSFQGEVGAVPAHGNTQMRGGHRGGIVHPVTDEEHTTALLLQGLHVADLVRGQQTGADVGDPHFAAQTDGGGGIVSAQQDGRVSGECLHAGHGGTGVGTHPVRQGQHPGRGAVDDHNNRGARLLLGGSDGRGGLGGDAAPRYRSSQVRQ